MADDFEQFQRADAGAGSPSGSDFDQFSPATPSGSTSLSQQARAAAEAGGRAALETSGFAAGAALGTAAGAPLGPAGALIGGLAGGVGGYFAGELAAEGGLKLRSPEQMLPSERPGGFFGQSLGGSVTMGAAPFALARTGIMFADTMVGRFLNQIVNTARTRPIATATSEAAGAVSAATGAAVSEIAAPGRADVRANAELAAGALNPTRLVLSAADSAVNLTRRTLATMSPAARETAAARVLADLTAITGEDPAVLARLLREPSILGEQEMTAAQKSGSVALAGLSDYLAKQNLRYGAESEQKARDALDAIRGQITLLSKTGDPNALSAAAQLRAQYYRTLIATRVAGAETQALRSADQIARGDTPAAREQLSVQAREALSSAITDARAAERALWARVDGTRPVQTSNLEQTFNELAGDLLPEIRNEKLPSVVSRFLNRVTQPGQVEFDYDPQTLSVRPMTPRAAPGTNVNEMKQLRSELLDLARASDRAGEYGQARIYNQLAEATLDDMDAAFKQAGDTAYDEARTFTREFNDTFSRSFAGRVVAQGKYGDRVAPELLLRKALATGKESGALQMQELEEATRFMLTRGLGDDTSVRQMLDAQERIFRIAASDAIDPMTGRVKPERVAKFVKDNPTLLARFPEVRTDLLNAVRTEDGLRRMENRAKNVQDIIAKQGAFAQVMGSNATNPAAMAEAARKAADRAIIAADQEAEIGRLISIAQGGGAGRGGRTPTQTAEAMDGLRTSIFNAVLDRSVRGNTLDIEAARQLLFTPSSVGKKSPVQVMQEKGLIDADTVKNMQRLFDAASAIQRSQRPGTAVEVKQDLTDMATATLSRMLGSGLAGGAARAAGSASPSLIVHGAGARLAEQAMTKLPLTNVNKVLTEAMNDPKKMALLLDKAPNPQKAAEQARQLNAWFVQSGLTGIGAATENELRPYLQQDTTAPQFFTR